MANLSCKHLVVALAWWVPFLLGCSGPMPSGMANAPQLMSTSSLDDPPACYSEGVEQSPGTVVVTRCREIEPMGGKCVDAMCQGCMNNGAWSAPFECVP